MTFLSHYYYYYYYPVQIILFVSQTINKQFNEIDQHLVYWKYKTEEFIFYLMFQIVFIPITTHGYFYAVSTANNTAEDNVSKVYQIAKLLQVFPLPVRVCSIYPQKINGTKAFLYEKLIIKKGSYISKK